MSFSFLSLFKEEKEEPFTLKPNFAYRLVRSNRKTLSLVIEENGLCVRAPRWTPITEIELFIEKESAWIEKKLNERDAQNKLYIWKENGAVPFLGHTLKVRPTSLFFHLDLEKKECLVPMNIITDEMTFKKTYFDFCYQEAKRIILSRAKQFFIDKGLKVKAIKLTRSKNQWGSCSADKVIRLHWQLVFLSPEIIDYVLVHEASHLTHMDHSKRFWTQVESFDSFYKEHRAQLKKSRILSL